MTLKAVVTGGGSGIGLATATLLAGRGMRVACLDLDPPGEPFVGVKADVTDDEQVRRAVAEAAERLGGIDILVNNAGIGVLGPIGELSLGDVDRVLAVNVRSVFLASQAAAGLLRDGGRIISVGTALTRYAGGPGGTLYALSKSALTGLTKALAHELGGRRITVNLVQPGPVDTDMNPADGPFAEGQRANTALGRFGSADEVASLVGYLAGADAAYVTGTELTVDGGHSA